MADNTEGRSNIIAAVIQASAVIVAALIGGWFLWRSTQAQRPTETPVETEAVGEVEEEPGATEAPVDGQNAAFSPEGEVAATEWVEGEVLFEDDFEDGELTGWIASPNWRVIEDDDGNHVLEGGGVQQTELLVGSTDWENYAFETWVRVDQIGAYSAPYRVVFRNTGANCNRYVWTFTSWGDSVLDRQRDCNASNLSLNSLPVSSVYDWVTLRATVTGNTVRGYVNGQRVFEVTDDLPLSRGGVGLAALNRFVVWFDDVRVVELVPAE